MSFRTLLFSVTALSMLAAMGARAET
ncbi:MAG TPA: hypothetical protein PLH31_01895, partial [Caulobacter sp.]|nr:hypothetical protein [Caulobacter sp.]